MDTIEEHHDATSAVATDPKTQRNILIAVCTALIAVIASVSGLNVAQQDLAIDLGASQSAVLWIINAYTIALAALLLPIGAVGDRWGRKPVLLAGLAVFGTASLGAALAPTVAVMIVARVAAGVGAAMIMPVTLSVITSSFPPADRARAIGIWAGFAGSGGILGLFVSSFMVDVVTWRWLFVLPISLVIVSLIATVAFVPNSREDMPRRLRPRRFAAVGAGHREHRARHPRRPGAGLDRPDRPRRCDRRRARPHRLRHVGAPSRRTRCSTCRRSATAGSRRVPARS